MKTDYLYLLLSKTIGKYRGLGTGRTASASDYSGHAVCRHPRRECAKLSWHWAMVLRWPHRIVAPKFHLRKKAAEVVPWAFRSLPMNCGRDYCKHRPETCISVDLLDILVPDCIHVQVEFQTDQRLPGSAQTRKTECSHCGELNSLHYVMIWLKENPIPFLEQSAREYSFHCTIRGIDGPH